MTVIPICTSCKLLRKGMTCVAFPDGIPDQILFHGFDHRKPFEGDHGIRFEKSPEITGPIEFSGMMTKKELGIPS